ncbi:MAG: nicotinamide mononucleotide transporter [Bacteroidales bacterium]|nr:nicotinamide mononucleotide transporter [Bacteroidales bacterium]
MTSWISEQYVEILGVIFSLLYLFFSIRQKILLWPMGIISALLYMVVFYQSKFYADMGLNGYYFIISIYGWILWNRGRNKTGGGLPVTRITSRVALLLAVITLGAFFGIGLLLDHFTDSPVPYWDAFTTAVSFTATWMLARKILEHWILWIIVDAVSMGLYLYRGLYPTLVLFAVYTAMAVIGFIQWKKNLQTTAA